MQASNLCPKCSGPISGGSTTVAGQQWHLKCFTCGRCGKQLKSVYEHVGSSYYCDQCAFTVKQQQGPAVNIKAQKGYQLKTGGGGGGSKRSKPPTKGNTGTSSGKGNGGGFFSAFGGGKKNTASKSAPPRATPGNKGAGAARQAAPAQGNSSGYNSDDAWEEEDVTVVVLKPYKGPPGQRQEQNCVVM